MSTRRQARAKFGPIGILAGAANASRAETIPFMCEADHLPMVLVDQGAKKVMCFAQIANMAAAQHGITELNLADHTLSQVTASEPLT